MFLFKKKVVYLFNNLAFLTMRKIIIALLTLLFLSCSSDNSVPVRRLSFKVNGTYKLYEDIRVQSYVDNNFGVPFTRLSITATPKDGGSEFFAVDINRGGDFDGKSINGLFAIDGIGYNYNFDHPLTMNLSVNTSKRIKGTFQGIYTNEQGGENVTFTNGTIDITYYPDNGTYIKH